MANAVSIEVEGLEQLRLALRTLPEKVQSKILGAATAKAALPIRNAARAASPMKTGRLRRNIRSTRGKRNGSEASAFVSVRKLNAKAVAKFKRTTGKKATANPNDAFYWRHHEFGTAKMRARPFLRPAFEQQKFAAVQVLKEALDRGIQTEAAKAGGLKAT